MKPIEVFDKQGNRVTRHNGILADGDHMRMPISLMDHKPIIDPRLEQAMRDANAAKRTEKFDKKAIMDEVEKLTPFQRAIFNDFKVRSYDLSEALRIAKHTTTVVNTTLIDTRTDEMIQAQELPRQQYEVYSQAVDRGMSVPDALRIARNTPIINRATAADTGVRHRPGPFVADNMPTADRLNHINAVSDAEKARDARIKRNADAWKHPPTVIDVTEITGPVTTSEEEQERLNKERGVKKPKPDETIDHAAARDRRTEQAWQKITSA